VGGGDICEDAVNELVDNPPNESAVRTITAVSVLNARLESLTATTQMALPSQSPAAQVANASLTGVISALKAKIHSLLSQLWHLISNLFNPTGWSIGGDTGFNLLGLQGNVSLQIKFG
jgi:hypothetical protein